MRIYLIDDDIQIIRILKKIIIDRKLGDIVGSSTSSLMAESEISIIQPEIVLVDLLIPQKDGLYLVKELKNKYPQMEFIMISQVSSKDMIGRAYKYGVEYFINKPVNALEVESIIKKVKERIRMMRKLNDFSEKESKSSSLTNDNDHDKSDMEKYMGILKDVIMQLGIMGEKGTQDILMLCEYIISHSINLNDYTLRELCTTLSEKPKSMEQRMRRSIMLAMTNIAHIGIEDYMNETFVEFSNRLFQFEQVRTHMDYIRKKSEIEGSVAIKKFVFGLIQYCENKIDSK
ncbi:DNA-binding domain-containing protein [Proteocatella sphenisci]|uniref:DNA-binding domain-containing protein n=1 Tax=Proteocatella sphenisci TaxID=181070 RepID=UPI00048DDADA|nr:DNA-binding domain-containing protein [Proteocatella sphenisci]